MDRVARLAERFIRSHFKASVIYVGVFLPVMARKRLLKAFPPEHDQVWAHHMTIWHYKDGVDIPDLPWGSTVSLKVVKHLSGRDAQAVSVDPPTRLRPVAGRVPHITISTPSGGAPAASKDLFGDEWDPVRGLVAMKGQVGWVDESEKVHFRAPPNG